MATEQDFLRSFGRKLATIRKQKGFTQESLGDAVDMHYTYISLIERGQRKATITTVFRIARALKIDIKELF